MALHIPTLVRKKPGNVSVCPRFPSQVSVPGFRPQAFTTCLIGCSGLLALFARDRVHWPTSTQSPSFGGSMSETAIYQQLLGFKAHFDCNERGTRTASPDSCLPS